MNYETVIFDYLFYYSIPAIVIKLCDKISIYFKIVIVYNLILFIEPINI
jgi:hypothetical protein